MSDATSTRVDELVDALKRRRAPLPFEIGAYVALAACERLIESPARVAGREVHIASDGDVRVVGAPPVSDAESARALGALLAQLLVAAGPGVPPALLALVETRAPASLDAMRDGLARALMPLNRAASRRVLARLVRESIREPRSTVGDVLEVPPSVSALDEDLDALLGEAPPAPDATPPAESPDASAPATSVSSLAAALAALAEEEAAEDAAQAASAAPAASRSDVSPPAVPLAPAAPAAAPASPAPPPAASGVASPSSAGVVPAPAIGDSRASAPVGSSPSPAHPRLGRLSLEGIDEAPRAASGGGRGRIVLAVLVLAGLAALALFARPAWFAVGSETPRAVPPRDATPAPPEDPLAQVADVAARGSIVVRCAAPGAEVLAFVGRGPALTEPLPQGVGHEFVVLADGKAASRGVVPADATWDTSPEGPLYELALQSGEADVPFAALDFGPSRLAPGGATPGRAQGRVRVITTPRGAKVYRVAGAGPSVRLENARTDAAIELLVAAPGHVPERVVVGPSDWHVASGTPTATLDVTLTPRPAD